MLVIETWLKTISGWLAALSAAAGIVIMLLMLTDVVARNWITHRSLPGVYELIETITVLVLAFGVAHAEQIRANPRVSLLTERLSARAVVAVRTVGEAVMMAVVVWFAYGTTCDAIVAVQRGEHVLGVVRFPVWPTKIMLAAGFVLLALYLLNDTVRSITRIARNDIPVSAPEEEKSNAS